MKILLVLFLASTVLLSGCIEAEFPAYNSTKNYCGPEGLFSVPRGSLTSDADFNYACYEHDKCYAECKKTGNTQAHCDQLFRDIMDDSCNQMFDAKMNACDAMSGWNPFKYTCISKARLQASSCWTQASAYHNGVSVGGKAVGAYPC